MKRISVILVALLILCMAIVPMSASAAEAKPLWVSHFNDALVEGSGVIMTTDYTGAGWWIHFAFEPTNVEDVYTITAVSNGLADGSAQPLPIPEGGFVYALNTGNDYITLGTGDTDFTSPNCSNAIADYTMNWMVGTNIKFIGVDLENLVVPTSTPDLKWYDDNYVCTATYEIYDGEVSAPESSEVVDDSSEPAAESSEEASEPAASEQEPAASTADSSAAQSAVESADSSVDASTESEGLGIWLWVIIGAAVVVVAVVVVVVKRE